MKIGYKIRKIRKDNKLSQEEFADLVNVSRSSVALYECNLRKPSIDTLKIICEKFNVKLDFFYNEIKDNDNHNIRRSFIYSLLMAFVIVLSLVSCRAISIHEKYGYNIYNDKEKVEHCSEICIIRIDSKIDKNTYKITLIDKLNVNLFRDVKYVNIVVSNNVFVENNHFYLFFNNYQYNENILFEYDNLKAQVNHFKLIYKLENYDESLKYYEQTGECKSVIDYYINLINDK